jgi:uncharacterized protein (DUF1015 family)
MPNIFPFPAIRPLPKYCAEVAAPPYDVVSAPEASAIIEANPLSFLRVSLSNADPRFSEARGVPFDHAWAKQNLQEFLQKQILFQDQETSFYVYRISDSNHAQVGLVGALDARESMQGAVKIHELTRPIKEQDRLDHMVACGVQTEPILLAYKNDGATEGLFAEVIQSIPLYRFSDSEGVNHEVWKVADSRIEEKFVHEFGRIQAVYIADGHHRYAAALRLAQQQKQSSGKILAVCFPHDQLRILPYHRVVQMSPSISPEILWKKLTANFKIERDLVTLPKQPGEFGVYAGGAWRKLIYRSRKPANSKLPLLDVTILHQTVFSPIFGIHDERRDHRIDFIGGLNAQKKIEAWVNTHEYAVGFFLHPVSILDLFAYADQGEVMPPKSTWFEPKLKSGLFALPLF